MTIHRRGVLAAGLGLAASPALAASDLSLEQVIERHTRARGGAAALDQVKSCAVALEITEGGSTVRARYRASLTPRMRIDVFAGDKRVWSEGLDAAGAWTWPGDKPAAGSSSADGAKALMHGIHFNLLGLHAFPAHGHKLTLAGRETVAGVNYYVIQVDMADGFQTFRYIDPVSWQVGRERDVRAIHPDLDAKKKLLEQVMEDYRPVEGVMVSFRSNQVDVAAGKVLQTTLLTSQRFNPPGADEAVDRSAAPPAAA